MPRIAFIADIHHGLDAGTKKSSQALALFAGFVAFVAEQQPDLVIDLGDRIADHDHDTDLVLEQQVAQAFKAVTVPVRHLTGNHDGEFLTVEENERVLGQSLRHEVLDLGTWQVVLWHTDARIHHLPEGHSFALAPGDPDWLETQVRAASKPTVLATHVPMSGQSQRSNYYFHNNAGLSIYPELAEIQAVLRGSRVPMICVSGHVHWSTLTVVDAIPHVTLQSLTESCTSSPHPARAWGLLELGDMISRSAYGQQRFSFSLNAQSTTRRWVTPHPPFVR